MRGGGGERNTRGAGREGWGEGGGEKMCLLRVFQPLVQLGQPHKLRELLEEDLHKDSTEGGKVSNNISTLTPTRTLLLNLGFSHVNDTMLAWFRGSSHPSSSHTTGWGLRARLAGSLTWRSWSHPRSSGCRPWQSRGGRPHRTAAQRIWQHSSACWSPVGGQLHTSGSNR